MMDVTADSVSYRYANASANNDSALTDVSFTLPPGAVLGVFGPNGAGKSTLLRCIAGLLTPTAGVVQIGGVSSANRTRIVDGTVAYVSSSVQLPRALTLHELQRQIAPFHARWDWNLATDLEHRFAIDGSKQLSSLARGEALLASLICALASRPLLLLLDEPFSGTDLRTRDAVLRGLLTESAANGTSVVITSHEVNDLESALTHVGVLAGGQLCAFGTTEELAERFSRVSMIASERDAMMLAQEQPWLSIERAGRMVRVVVDNTVTPIDPWMLERRFQDADSLHVESMPLREVVQLLSKPLTTANVAEVSA